MQRIADLFAQRIDRKIEEVIKVDQADEEVIRDELAEYVVTDAIARQQREVLEAYLEVKRKPHEGTAVWVSGFFGSGKSSFAKTLGLALADRPVCGTGAAELLRQRVRDQRVQQLLRLLPEQAPTEAVIFDVSTDRGVRAGSQPITEIMYRQLLQHLGYARELDLAELEITLEGEGRLGEFAARYEALHGRPWDRDKLLPALAMGRASAVLHALEPATYNAPDSWSRGVKGRADISPGQLAERSVLLLDRRRAGRGLAFVIDEVGQFVARDVQKMLDLQGVVQSLGRVGRGRLWIVVTSQEKLTELVSGLDQSRVELARLMDRFPLQVHLEPSDIAEVTSKRVLAKHAEGEAVLRAMFQAHRARLQSHTQVHTPSLKLPELTAERFMDLYPLLPYQIDLVIHVVSGLRTQGGASKHVGGANRTIIKLAQQLLIHPDVDVGNRPVGALVTLDRVYDLVAGNVASELRQKIDAIGRTVDHPLAAPVAKAICLLQYVQSVPRTAENLAATLHPAVDADSRLPEVREALAALVEALQIREGEDGYRIPSPAEDDWEQQRARLRPKPVDASRILAEVVAELWSPQPTHTLEETRPFKAGLFFHNRQLVQGDLDFHLALASSDQGDDELRRLREELRARSQTERKALFWAARASDAVARATDEVFRSQELLARRERTASSRDESALVAEEKRRLRRQRDELRRLLREALLAGTIYFRGNDRSPSAEAGAQAGDVGRAASRALASALPEVFDRFREAAARVGPKDLTALLEQENLRGLPPVFAQLGLVREEKGKAVFRTEAGPLAEVLARITDRHQYGDAPSGRALAEWFASEPYGWDFDVVRLFAACLLRAGKVEVVSKGQVLEGALSLGARAALPNNNLFRQASFRPKVSLDYAQVVEAYQRFREVFGQDVAELEQGVVARAIQQQAGQHERALAEVHQALATRGLPGAPVLAEALDQLRGLRGGSEENAILGFVACWHEVKEAIARAAELEGALTEPSLLDLARAREAVVVLWPYLQAEPDLPAGLAAQAAELGDLLQRETFFRELPRIDQLARALQAEHARRFEEAAAARAQAYVEALAALEATPGWDQLVPDQRERVAAPLAGPSGQRPAARTPIPQVRAETEACPARLARAVEDLLRMVDGNRVVRVQAARYFQGGIDDPDQLQAAIDGLRAECERLLGAGKKVLVQ